MHALKLALNKSMRASDDEQDINKLRPKFTWKLSICIFHCLPKKKKKRNKYSPNELRVGNKIHTFSYKFKEVYNVLHENEHLFFQLIVLSFQSTVSTVFSLYIVEQQMLRTKNHLLSSSGTKSAEVLHNVNQQLTVHYQDYYPEQKQLDLHEFLS